MIRALTGSLTSSIGMLSKRESEKAASPNSAPSDSSALYQNERCPVALDNRTAHRNRIGVLSTSAIEERGAGDHISAWMTFFRSTVAASNDRSVLDLLGGHDPVWASHLLL